MSDGCAFGIVAAFCLLFIGWQIWEGVACERKGGTYSYRSYLCMAPGTVLK